MECLYRELLFPELYNCRRAAKFVDALISPEIDSGSNEPAEQFCSAMPSADDVVEHLLKVCKLAIQKTREIGTFNCFFVAFQNTKPLQCITLVSKVPTTKEEIRELLCAGKCLAFANKAQSVFFASEIYHEDGKPILGQPIPESASWGIQVIGSSASGNSFRALISIQDLNGELIFSDPVVEINRDRCFDYPFARFFSITDEDEMSDILSQIPTLSQNYPTLTEQATIKNFAITMKALLKLGYHK